METKNDKTWINAGVIGMYANDGTTDTWYTTMNEKGTSFHRLRYEMVYGKTVIFHQ